MKIIFFNESWVIGGSNKYFESLIQVAIKENHEVEYIINNENSLVTESLKDKITLTKINVFNLINKVNLALKKYKYINSIFKVFIILNPIIFIFNILQFVNLLRKRKVDLVISCNGGYPGGESCLSLILASKLLNIKNILLVASMPQKRKKITYPYEILFDLLVDKSTSLLAACSRSQISSMQNLRGISGKRFEVLHNALNEEIKAEKIKKNNNDIVKLGTISRIDKNKSISTLISAVSQLKTAGYKVFFEIIGDGPELKNLKRQSLKQGLTDNDILFRGFVEGDVDNYLVDFDVFLFSSLWEGLPFSILEAMKYKVPIITSPSGGIEEAIIDNKTGIIVRENLDYKFANAIKMIIDNKDISTSLATNAYELFKKKFSSAVLHKNFKNILNSI